MVFIIKSCRSRRKVLALSSWPNDNDCNSRIVWLPVHPARAAASWISRASRDRLAAGGIESGGSSSPVITNIIQIVGDPHSENPNAWAKIAAGHRLISRLHRLAHSTFPPLQLAHDCSRFAHVLFLDLVSLLARDPFGICSGYIPQRESVQTQ